MGVWITYDDVLEEYGERDIPLTVDEQNNDVPNEQKVKKNIESAEMIVKGYLEQAGVIQYDDEGDEIDLSPNQINFIREPLLSITRYYYSDETFGNTEIILKRYENARKLLQDIASGNLQFPKNPLVEGKSSNGKLFNGKIIRG